MRGHWLVRGIAGATGIVVALGLGAPAVAADPTPTPTGTACVAPPVSGSVVGQSATSLTFALSVSLACGFQAASVTVYTSFDDAQMSRNARGSAVARTSAEAAALTVTGLTPGTAYWYRFAGGGSNFSSLVMGPAHTATQAAGCAATYQLDGSWEGGFVARVTVQNTSGGAIAGWRVNWTWPDGQALTAAWSATATSAGAAVSVANAGYNGALAADASTAFGFLGAGAGPASLTLTCSLTT
ncbi:cellulose binding domain-containing protein [Luedemannella helvata]|uniref:CBM2 domain-containing protein n=1 Tax=Luedemannella helvata TaxID=349315 RepID=A0ABP4WUD5_9ACTN